MKYLSLFLIVVLLFSVTSCTNLGSDLNEPSDEITCSHAWKSATCTKPKTCSKCQETQGDALGHTTNSGTCSRCGESFSAWKLGEYTDEFNQPTGKKYMIVDTYGTFSNSATTNSSLYAALQIDNDDIGIMLWEYSSNLLKGTFDSENYDITILDESNTKHYFTGTIYKSGTRIYFRSADRNTVLNLLQSNNSLKLYLKSTKYSISSYLFTIDTIGFDEAYNTIN